MINSISCEISLGNKFYIEMFVANFLVRVPNKSDGRQREVENSCGNMV